MSLQRDPKIKENLLNLTYRTSFKDTIADNISQIAPSKKMMTILLFISPIVMHISSKLVQAKKTLEIIKDINTSLLTVFIALIAIIITGYAIFQAMISRRHAIKLLSIEENQKSMLTKFNGYFFTISIAYFVAIVVDVSINILINLITNNVIIFEGYELIKSYLFTVYILINIILLWEFKSFIYNLYVCFISNVVTIVTEVDEAAATKEINKT